MPCVPTTARRFTFCGKYINMSLSPSQSLVLPLTVCKWNSCASWVDQKHVLPTTVDVHKRKEYLGGGEASVLHLPLSQLLPNTEEHSSPLVIACLVKPSHGMPGAEIRATFQAAQLRGRGKHPSDLHSTARASGLRRRPIGHHRTECAFVATSTDLLARLPLPESIQAIFLLPAAASILVGTGCIIDSELA